MKITYTHELFGNFADIYGGMISQTAEKASVTVEVVWESLTCLFLASPCVCACVRARAKGALGRVVSDSRTLTSVYMAGSPDQCKR